MMAQFKTLQDVHPHQHGYRSSLPKREEVAYLQLHRLTSEQARLKHELEQLRRHQERSEQRLAVVRGQIALIQQKAGNSPAVSSGSLSGTATSSESNPDEDYSFIFEY